MVHLLVHHNILTHAAKSTVAKITSSSAAAVVWFIYNVKLFNQVLKCSKTFNSCWKKIKCNHVRLDVILHITFILFQVGVKSSYLMNNLVKSPEVFRIFLHFSWLLEDVDQMQYFSSQNFDGIYGCGEISGNWRLYDVGVLRLGNVCNCNLFILALGKLKI